MTRQERDWLRGEIDRVKRLRNAEEERNIVCYRLAHNTYAVGSRGRMVERLAEIEERCRRLAEPLPRPKSRRLSAQHRDRLRAAA